MHALVTHASGHLPGNAFASDPRQLQRVAAALAISLALHALLLSIQRQPRSGAASAPVATLTVRLRPVTPPAVTPAPPQAVPQPAPARGARPSRSSRSSRPSRPVIAVAPQTRQADDDTHALAPAPAVPPSDEAPPAPAFDLDAARGMARRLAREPDPGKAGTALARLPPQSLETESRLARGIGAAKRAHCKDGVPGGLLAPLYLMMDKKDSGCKW